MSEALKDPTDNIIVSGQRVRIAWIVPLRM